MQPEIENLVKTYGWSMDELDKETWLGVFSDNLESYTAYMFGNPVPVSRIPVSADDPLYDTIGHLPPKQQLAAKCDGMIFKRIKVGQSTISNILISVSDTDAATGKDYFRHWEIVNPDHPECIARDLDDKYWYFQEGKHEWEFHKENGEWRVTKFKCVIYRREVRERQDLT
ncbi:MAG TPA: SnoaL-like domain-containing protein [Dehalococcoidia bacterium]|nr:SnoaL-like domain-containing protein [Dehalococcoidia bacterium]